MVIPIYDSDPLEKSRMAYVNWALIAANVIVFLFQQSSDNADATAIRDFALFPVALTGNAVTGGPLPGPVTLLTYMFLHGGWAHLFFNMLFLFTFGDNIEDALGHVRYFIFYILCGVAAGAAHAFMAQDSNVPLVGASGAIAGVVAAYMMLRPCARITALAFGLVPLRLSSVWVLGFWVVVQVWHVLTHDQGDTAWWAHIGGLIAGVAIVTVIRPAGVILFECMRPGDVAVATSDSAPGGGAPPLR